ncbi:MAG TPA: lipid A export permease/ATP-binding protein MsbA [Candidatus Deferrimicrobiaceae bacterium]|nr:lipid A export permease/ATP-binding protein MsbA [Candidatus Deferrimicrobiaceae bacterium]
MGVTVYQRMLAYVRPYTLRLLCAMLFMIIVSSFRGAIAFLVKPALDDIFINKDATRLAIIPLLVLGVYLLKAVFEFAQSYMMRGVGQQVIRDIRDHLYRHMQSLSLSFYMRHPTGVLMSRVTNDVGLMQGAVTEAVTGLIKDVFTALFLVGVVFYRDWQLALIALVAFPLAFWPIARFGRKLRKTSIRTQEVTGSLTSHLQETISGAKLVKSFGAEEYEVDRFTTRNADLFRLSMKVAKVQAMTSPLSEMFAGIGAAAVIFYGGYSVVNGHSTPGNFFSFMTALFMLYEPVKSLSRINNVIQQGIAAAIRVFEVLDTLPDVEEKPDAPDLPAIAKEIEFDHVDFRYAGEGEYILKDIAIRVPLGAMVAVVGSSGAGKTTLVDLLPRFYDPQHGAIRIDGRDIRDVSLASLRSQIGIVSQHTILFNDTVRNNIAYGTPKAPMEKVEEAARRANAHGFIARLPEGYDTVVGEQGLKLSGGERQRVAIARGLLKDAPILILDEATSALDSESESVVQEALEHLMRGRTTFVIAHRLSTVRNADTILVIEEGRIVESGRHEELLRQESRYRSFYLKQFEERRSVAEARFGEG